MVIFYDKTTKVIKRVEDNVITPALPANMTFDEKKAYYATQNEDFVCMPYEMGRYVFDYNLCFDANGAFTGLQPK